MTTQAHFIIDDWRKHMQELLPINREEAMIQVAFPIAERHNTTIQVVQGTARHRPVVQARSEIIRALYQRNFTLQEIGYFLKRDHTTVGHHIRKNP